jgi:AcrR family transcriptional regulator
MAYTVRRAMRCDAARSHARVIGSAREAFAHTPDATLKAVARGAGVGQGTVHRHFPTPDHLLLTVREDTIEELADAAALLLERHEPIRALRLWLERLASYGTLGTASARAVAAVTRTDAGGPAYARICRALEGLLGACRTGRRSRQDVSVHEVLLPMSYAWVQGGQCASPGRRDALDILMDGLRAGA